MELVLICAVDPVFNEPGAPLLAFIACHASRIFFSGSRVVSLKTCLSEYFSTFILRLVIGHEPSGFGVVVLVAPVAFS